MQCKRRKTTLLPIAAATTLAMTGCFSTDDMNGTLTLSVTDAPVDDAEAVVVEFTGVELKPAGEDRVVIEFDQARSIDLLALQGNASETLLEEESIPPGEYEWIQVNVNAERLIQDSYIAFEDGSQESLFMPSGAETGLRLVSGFVVPITGEADFTIDFDLRKSIANPESLNVDYTLRPALRIVDNTEVGSIVGTVDSEWAADSECAPAVYVYEGHDAPTGSVGSDEEPLTSTLVDMNDVTGEFHYEVGFVPEGDYTAAFTCEADEDEPEQSNNIDFLQSLNTSVTAGEETELHFSAN
jgi:hypothetical protein